MFAIFNAYSPPDMLGFRRTFQRSAQQTLHALRAFCKDLIRVPIGGEHYFNHACNIVLRNFRVEEIAHRIDKDALRRSPFERLHELLGNKTKIESSFKGVTRHSAKALRKGLRVAVLAARAHFRATAYRIPCSIGPFDFRMITHMRSDEHLPCGLILVKSYPDRQASFTQNVLDFHDVDPISKAACVATTKHR